MAPAEKHTYLRPSSQTERTLDKAVSELTDVVKRLADFVLAK